MNHTGCTCKTPGYCERHGCVKTEAWWKLCQTREDYFALWESGKGPGQKGNVKASGNGKPRKRKKRCGDKHTSSIALADSATIDTRMATCATCEHVMRSSRLRCKLLDLGCSHKLMARIRLPDGTCPAGKWSVVNGAQLSVVSRGDADRRTAVCSTCHNYVGDRCSKLPHASLRKVMFDPRVRCPENKWITSTPVVCHGVIQQPGRVVIKGVRLERKVICQSCEHYTYGGCAQIDNGCPICYYRAWQDEVPRCPQCKWLAQWRPVDDEIAVRSDRAVVVVATGSHFTELLNITGPTIAAYAERCNADYYALTNTTQNWWGLEKFRVHHFAQRYERTLFVDGDIIIRSNAPNLFDMVPPGRIGMHDDLPHLPYTQWIEPDWRYMCESQGKPYRNSGVILNTGLVVCDKTTADIWRPPQMSFQPTHCSEQFWVDAVAMEYDIHYLPTNVNVQFWMPQFWGMVRDAHVIHLANCQPHRRMVLAERLSQW